ncbi:LysR family transcriptional regulator [Variovorax sp. J22R133]|uniref:LysR family transcriptional regulator n=1 Tax=Variovorax brevis TaxID=3053503 RepID=UPI0025779BEA|nr:LysR family transcriptional regulator [Variovorax sp. J22R133]MDM0116311.1 LysR family transcriptional regulator [Variovorax sp. J22R133]
MSADRFREFETFVAVVESGSFSAASRKLGCTPSAVSKLIERMENRLGVRLLQRTSRSLSLTQEGRNLHRSAIRVLEAISDAESTLSEVNAPATGLLRVHTTLNFAQTQLAPVLPGFLALHPQLRIEFILNSEPIDLVNADIDLSLQVGPVTNPSLIARRIATTRWLLCAAPEYLKTAGVPRVPEDLLDHNCLNFLPQTYRSVWPLRTDEGEQGSSAPTRYEAVGNVASNSDNFLRVLACQGMGIARLAAFHISQDLKDGRLLTVLGGSIPDLPEPVFAVYQSRRNLSSRVKVFLKFLEERLAESMDWRSSMDPPLPIESASRGS